MEEWHIRRWKQSGWENTLTWGNRVLRSFTEADIFSLAEVEWHVMFSVRAGFSYILIFNFFFEKGIDSVLPFAFMISLY